MTRFATITAADCHNADGRLGRRRDLGPLADLCDVVNSKVDDLRCDGCDTPIGWVQNGDHFMDFTFVTVEATEDDEFFCEDCAADQRHAEDELLRARKAAGA